MDVRTPSSYSELLAVAQCAIYILGTPNVPQLHFDTLFYVPDC